MYIFIVHYSSINLYVFSKPTGRSYKRYHFFKELSNTTKIHEHDFITFGAEEKSSVICSTCGLFYCETCGKSAKEMVSDSVDDLQIYIDRANQSDTMRWMLLTLISRTAYLSCNHPYQSRRYEIMKRLFWFSPASYNAILWIINVR